MTELRYFLLGVVLFLVLPACVPVPAVDAPAPPISDAAPAAIVITAHPQEPAPEEAPNPPSPSIEEPVIVAFVKDGDIHLWDSTTMESETIFTAGDVTAVSMSDDGQVIAFLRLSVFEQPELWEQYALWAVDSTGANPRELVPAETMRKRLNPRPTDSTGIAELDWLPGTHRLVYSGTKYFAPGQDKPAAEDVYLVDTDTLADTLLAPAGNGVRVSGIPDGRQFVPSPDGRQVALLSGSELSFVNVDGSNLRPAVLTYPLTGSGDVPFVPTGVWTRDGRSFLINAPIQNNDLAGVLNFTITRVPVDGSPAEPIATIISGLPVSLTFSPDGQQAAFGSVDQQHPEPIITPLAGEAGLLAIPYDFPLEYLNAHWSPSGDAYVIQGNALWRLCPNATQGSQVCGDPVALGEGSPAGIHWLDSTRFLYLTSGPPVLYLTRLDGPTVTIVTWPLDEWVSPQSFTAAKVSQ